VLEGYAVALLKQDGYFDVMQLVELLDDLAAYIFVAVDTIVIRENSGPPWLRRRGCLY
jgi:hypothetical protein